MYMFVCLSLGVSARCDWSSLPPEATRYHLYPTRLPPEANATLSYKFTTGGRAGFLYPTNLPPEAKREYPLSCKFTAGGNA